MTDNRYMWPLAILHYVYPTTVFVYFAVTSSIAVCTLQTASAAAKTTHVRHRVIVYLLIACVLSFAVQIIVKILELLFFRRWPTQDTTIGLLSCILVFGIEQNSLGDASSVVWHPFYGSWILALIFEPAISALTIWTSQHEGLHSSRSPFMILDACVVLIRYMVIIAVIATYFVWRGAGSRRDVDEERRPLIPKKADQRSSEGDNSADSGYGTNTDTTNTEATNTETVNSPSEPESPWERHERIAQEQMQKRLQSEGSWVAYAKGFLLFFPYIWPVGNRRLQLYAGLVGLCLLAGNALNFLVPLQLGVVMDSLNGVSGKNPWTQVVIFAGLRMLASEAGIDMLRRYLWLPVEYYSQEALSVAAYSHVMRLSSDFHDSKSSSDLIVAISQGGSIANMLESICFQAIPSVIDLVVAFSYLSSKFGPYEGFITVATGIAFIQAVALMIGDYKERRKRMVKAYFEEHYVRQAGIQGWHTVSSFNQIAHEENRYAAAVKSQVAALKEIYTGYLFRQAAQYLILLAGLLAGAFLAVYQVTNGQATAGDFVMLLTYWGQLSSPLRFFAGLGRSLSSDLVQAERLLEVMLTEPTIVDKPNAKALNLKGGRIDFRNVSFSYDKKKDILKGVNLSVPSGTTAAFVGATGAGKSTILKLLDRFYDVTGGSIQIDGQDIRDVTLTSLRQCIGMVPQSPILFDDTVMNNIRYARLNASDEEVYSACKAAAMHDQIMGFTEGYKTRVGERGVKLSGGELQRVAIARAMLKQPEIVLLDEATSAVDTDTEQKIQEGLRALCKGRTTLIIAHRLSTVMNADVIFVVSEGQVVEHGSHEQLLAKEGKYAELWSKQIFLKPKESKADDKSTEEAVPEPTSQSTQTDGFPNGGTTTQDPKANGEAKGRVDGRVTSTPNGHEQEGSRLNPGAPEFTPRSAVTPKPKPKPVPIAESPLKRDWAEDMEGEVSSSPNRIVIVDSRVPPVGSTGHFDQPSEESSIKPAEILCSRPLAPSPHRISRIVLVRLANPYRRPQRRPHPQRQHRKQRPKNQNNPIYVRPGLDHSRALRLEAGAVTEAGVSAVDIVDVVAVVADEMAQLHDPQPIKAVQHLGRLRLPRPLPHPLQSDIHFRDRRSIGG
ncbi:hypothetical protein DL769_000516 [Monosporascus sp. CRB-8-3]|nr:hypothetical protein DL769_000516 [Monosporascus sp. CRB-8-3]